MKARFKWSVIPFVVWPTAVYGQAALEYALKSSGTAASEGGTDAVLWGCRVDSTALTCLSRSYPKTSIVVVAVLALIILRWLAGRHAAR